MSNGDSLVTVEELGFRYPGVAAPALSDISFTVEQGEIVLLLGPTGAGKSTLYMCLNGLIPHSVRGRMAGRVTVCGQDTSTTSVPELAQRIGFVFQDPDLQIFSLSVEDELAFGPENLGLPREEIASRVHDVQRAIELGPVLNREPARLSAGQKQSVAIASVLTMQPELLVMDEPTSSLDPQNTQKVLDLIRSLNEDFGKTILIAEHKIDDVAPLASRVVVLNEGRVVLQGDPIEVLTDIDSLHGAGLMGSTPAEFGHSLRAQGVAISKLPFTVEEALFSLDELFAGARG